MITRSRKEGIYTIQNLARASFAYFCTKILKMEWAPHHDEWNQLLETSDRALIECARGHGKTWFFSRAFVLWLLYSGRPHEILLISYSEDQARDLLRKITDEIEKNPHLSNLRPGAREVWQALKLTFATGATVRGEGFGSSIRGAHPDWILIDDPLKDRGGMDPEEQSSFFYGALSGMAKRNTKIFVIGTPLDAGDLLESLERNKRYNFKSYPALNDQKEPLFPYLFTKAELELRETEIGSLAFAREFLLQRVDPKTQPFKDNYKMINIKYEFPQMVRVRTLVDPAVAEKESACDSAIVTVGQDIENHLWELDCKLIHHDDTHALNIDMLNIAQRYSSQYGSIYAIGMEEEIFQKTVGFDFKRLCVSRGFDVQYIGLTHVGISGKHQRIMGLQGLWESRAIHLLPESPLIGQFRYYRPQIKGFKIDALDAFSWVRDERVIVPYRECQPYIGEVPDFVHEE